MALWSRNSMNCKIYKTLSPGSLTPHTTYLSVSFPFRSLPPLVSFDLTHPIAMSEFPSGREFCSNPSTAQLFYREPINGVLSPWIPLPQSDYHSPRHEIHNVRVPTLLPVCSSHPVLSLQALTGVSDGLGPISIRSTPATMSHVHGGYEALPPPSTQPYPTSQSSSLDGGQLFTQPTPVIHGRDSTTAPILQNPTQTKRTSRHARRSARAYDPLHGQQTRRSSGGGRGRTRGAANYKIREIEVLLDLVEEELPIASMGWRVVGSRFRDWASVTQQPARTDRSLELKFKQVGLFFISGIHQSLTTSHS